MIATGRRKTTSPDPSYFPRRPVRPTSPWIHRRDQVSLSLSLCFRSRVVLPLASRLRVSSRHDVVLGRDVLDRTEKPSHLRSLRILKNRRVSYRVPYEFFFHGRCKSYFTRKNNRIRRRDRQELSTGVFSSLYRLFRRPDGYTGRISQNLLQ